MATIKKKPNGYGQFGGFSPFGNSTTLLFALATDAAGVVIDSDSVAAVAGGDVIDLGELPEGMRLDDAQVFVTAEMTASIEASVGFKYTDGDSVDIPQDANYFHAAADLATVGRVRANGSKLITLPKPARLILTVAGAANAKASDIKVIVTGELTGPR